MVTLLKFIIIEIFSILNENNLRNIRDRRFVILNQKLFQEVKNTRERPIKFLYGVGTYY